MNYILLVQHVEAQLCFNSSISDYPYRYILHVFLGGNTIRLFRPKWGFS